MKKTLAGFVILVIVLLANIVIYAARPFGESFSLAGDIMVTSFSLAAAAFGFYAYRLHGWKSIQGRALLLFSIGALLWFSGEAIWSFFDITLADVPLPSYADAVWFLGYPFFIAGLYHLWKVTKVPLTKGRISLSYISAFAILVVMILYVALPAFLNPEESAVERAVAIGNVIGDTALIISCLVVIISLVGGKLITPWVILLTALILSSIADLAYSYMLT